MAREAGMALTVALFAAFAFVLTICTEGAHIGREGHGDGIDAIYSYDENSYLRIYLASKPIDRIDVVLISGHDTTQTVENVLVDRFVMVELRPLQVGTYLPQIQIHSTHQVHAECDLYIGDACTVRFLPGEGAGEMSPMEVLVGTQIELPASSFESPEGKVFDCWRSSDSSYTQGEKITLTTDMELTAVFKERSAGSDDTVLYASIAVVAVLALLIIFIFIRNRRSFE